MAEAKVQSDTVIHRRVSRTAAGCRCAILKFITAVHHDQRTGTSQTCRPTHKPTVTLGVNPRRVRWQRPEAFRLPCPSWPRVRLQPPGLG